MPFQPGHSGNPNGRPRGARNKRSLLAEKLYEARAEELVNASIDLALAGDGTALRVCMDRVLAPMKERPVEFDLPPMATAADAVTAMGAIAQGVADGDLDATEAGRLGRFVNNFAQTVATGVIEKELRELLKDRR